MDVPNDYSKKVIYRSRMMRELRVLMRLKLLQIGCLGGCSIPLTTIFSSSSSTTASLISALVIAGCGGSAWAMNFYVTRYIGELSLLSANKGPNYVVVSHLDFWGRRKDNIYPTVEVQPPFQGNDK